ncbi:L-fuculose-phosphate aldolase [Natronincola peptidivorans]|uniref:L-fuculose-phosphate aldolase n=1 Tax=Natronincola peptidivorans TaxID=426128 RepID=A0A1I0CYQ3_9FIRM|nr:class II aldolase/adducin family protein [Natronincola peptidivorans]SET24996.1 L-fuculose-phosphate aldolase [Natronincola peptidivorans]
MNNSYSSFQIKKQICDIGRRMYDREFVAANDGNISVRVSENEVWTTPTGVSKGFMTPDMMVKVDLNGKVLQGTHKPSSELKMHLKVYKEKPEVKAVVHAHPLTATALATAGIPLDRALLPEAVITLGIVPISQYATPSTDEVPESIAAYIKDYNAVLLANHGALTWGRDIFEAYYRMETVEFYSKIILTTQLIGHANELPCNKVGDLLKIREKMGITGITPSANCSIEPEEPKEVKASPQDMEYIAQKVTEAVLKKLNLG